VQPDVPDVPEGGDAAPARREDESDGEGNDGGAHDGWGQQLAGRHDRVVSWTGGEPRVCRVVPDRENSITPSSTAP